MSSSPKWCICLDRQNTSPLYSLPLYLNKGIQMWMWSKATTSVFPVDICKTLHLLSVLEGSRLTFPPNWFGQLEVVVGGGVKRPSTSVKPLSPTPSRAPTTTQQAWGIATAPRGPTATARSSGFPMVGPGDAPVNCGRRESSMWRRPPKAESAKVGFPPEKAAPGPYHSQAPVLQVNGSRQSWQPRPTHFQALMRGFSNYKGKRHMRASIKGRGAECRCFCSLNLPSNHTYQRKLPVHSAAAAMCFHLPFPPPSQPRRL